MDATFIATRRKLLGLTQRELSRLSGVKQPLISAIESGRREATASVSQALADALQVRPSVALKHMLADVRKIVRANHGRAAFLFGSIARGQDVPGSDVDLLVEFDEVADIADLLTLEDELEQLLTVPVDVISAGSSSRVTAKARRETVPL